MDLEQRRLRLHDKLKSISGLKNCYYSPPEGMRMSFPCIVYDLAGSPTNHADNIPYLRKLEWVIKIFDEDPDSAIASAFFEQPKCRFDRMISADGINQFVFTLYD